jgi:hypothetical protein
MLKQTKGRNREDKGTVEFRGEQGIMTPVIRCKEHDKPQRRLYTMCDMDHDGRVSSVIIWSPGVEAHRGYLDCAPNLLQEL